MSLLPRYQDNRAERSSDIRHYESVLRLTRVFPSRLHRDFPCHSSSPRSAPNNCTDNVSASKQEFLEESLLRRATEGSPQGGVISPCLSNCFLHHVSGPNGTNRRCACVR